MLTSKLSNFSCCWYHKGTNFQANHNVCHSTHTTRMVVADTTKVRIFKQITTRSTSWCACWRLLLIPQRYEFSSKSQPYSDVCLPSFVVADTTKVRIFKQITTRSIWSTFLHCCCWYHKGTNFQANHNTFCQCWSLCWLLLIPQRYEFSSKSQPQAKKTNAEAVVADTTKVRIFKQITTRLSCWLLVLMLLLIPQRYEFSSKSQLCIRGIYQSLTLLLIPQRYEFSSKSQPFLLMVHLQMCCCWYHKGTNFQANHN